MRPLYLFLFLIFAGSASLSAQFTEDFEDGIPGSWAIFDNGIGTSQSWTTSTTSCSPGSQSAFVRYENVSGGLAIDYLVTPLLTIDAGSPMLTYDFREAFGSNFGSQYEIQISTVSQTNPADFSMIYSYGETTTTPTVCRTETVDLTDYAGQDVYIAFVMINDDGDNFYLDNVSIDAVSDACTNPAATYAIVDNCGGAGTFNVTVTITNLGGATQLTVSDNQASVDQMATAVNEVLTFGPYTSGTSVVFTITNNDDGACSATSSAQTFVCPPVNNDCAGATTIPVSTDGSCSNPIMGTNVSSTASGETPTPSCSSFGSGVDNWYSVVVPASGNLTVEMTSAGGPGDWAMSIYSGDCGNLTEIECNDDDGVVNFPLISLTGRTPDEVLLVRVFEFSNDATGPFNICAHTLLCTEATAVFSVDDDCEASGGFFTDITITDFGSATVLTASNNINGSTLTLDLTTSSGTFGPFPTGTDVIVTLTPDDDVACSVTSNTLTLDLCPPANDACIDAIALTDATGMPTAASGAEYDSRGANSAASEPEGSCASFSNSDDDIWFSITAPAGSGDIITITAEDLDGGTTVDLVIVLYIGDCGNLVEVACADEEFGTAEEIIYEVPAARSAAPETFLLQAYRYGTGGGEFTVSASVNSILPVELTSFTGTAMEKANKLSWTTAREESADRYLVERSATVNGVWEAIGEVLAAGNSESEEAYELMDEQPINSAFYRLKMMDIDGSYTYSNIVQLENTSLLAGQLLAYPNPTNGDLVVSFLAKTSGQASLSVTDLNGRVVSWRNVGVSEGLQTQSFDLASAPAGLYLVRVNVDGDQLVRRVIRR